MNPEMYDPAALQRRKEASEAAREAAGKRRCAHGVEVRVGCPQCAVDRERARQDQAEALAATLSRSTAMTVVTEPQPSRLTPAQASVSVLPMVNNGEVTVVTSISSRGNEGGVPCVVNLTRWLADGSIAHASYRLVEDEVVLEPPPVITG